jgi:hypothetical protein
VSVLSDLEAKLGIVETDVVNFFATAKADIAAAATWLVTKALPWMEAHGQEIATDVTGLVGVVAAAGVGVPAPVLAASVALNEGVALVNDAISAAQQSAATGGSSVQQAVAAGAAAYAGLKTAQGATAVAQSAIAAPQPAAAPAPAAS